MSQPRAGMERLEPSWAPVPSHSCRSLQTTLGKKQSPVQKLLSEGWDSLGMSSTQDEPSVTKSTGVPSTEPDCTRGVWFLSAVRVFPHEIPLNHDLEPCLCSLQDWGKKSKLTAHKSLLEENLAFPSLGVKSVFLLKIC